MYDIFFNLNKLFTGFSLCSCFHVHSNEYFAIFKHQHHVYIYKCHAPFCYCYNILFSSFSMFFCFLPLLYDICMYICMHLQMYVYITKCIFIYVYAVSWYFMVHVQHTDLYVIDRISA